MSTQAFIEARQALTKIADRVPYERPEELNERYLHHHFSYLMHAAGYDAMPLVNGVRRLHPEWPTRKGANGLHHGGYRRGPDNRYLPVANGTGGFIDFTIGGYTKPEVAVEFSLKGGWAHEEVTYDLVKLLDPSNPFEAALSLNIVLRPRGPARGGRLARFEMAMRRAWTEAVARLNPLGLATARECWLVVTEIAPNSRVHRHYDPVTGRVTNGLPAQ